VAAVQCVCLGASPPDQEPEKIESAPVLLSPPTAVWWSTCSFHAGRHAAHREMRVRRICAQRDPQQRGALIFCRVPGRLLIPAQCAR